MNLPMRQVSRKRLRLRNRREHDTSKTDKQADSQTDENGRQTDRQTDRQTGKDFLNNPTETAENVVDVTMMRKKLSSRPLRWLPTVLSTIAIILVGTTNNDGAGQTIFRPVEAFGMIPQTTRHVQQQRNRDGIPFLQSQLSSSSLSSTTRLSLSGNDGEKGLSTTIDDEFQKGTDIQQKDWTPSTSQGFDGEGFAGYLAPYALGFLGALAATAALFKFVLLDGM